MYTGLVISGGGAKTIASMGMLGKMDLDGVLKDITSVSCCSAGSYIAVLWLLGVKFIDMLDFLPQEKMDVDIERIIRVKDRKGIFRIKKFTKKFKNFVREKLGQSPTLRDLQVYSGKTLYISVTDVTNSLEVHLNHVDNPDFPLLEAVYASSSYPLVFVPVKVGDTKYLDGGIVCSCPIQPLIGQQVYVVDCIGESADDIINFFVDLMRIPQKVRKHKDLQLITGKYICVKSTLGLLDFSDPKKNFKEFFHGWNQYTQFF